MSGDNQGMVFIVDISGYSHFIRDVDPTEGLIIIRRLLSKIIDCNRLSFRISEIEGDAILFYRMGIAPSVEDVVRQFAQMRNAFKRIILLYQQKFPEIGQLELKAIAHYGHIEEFKIDRFSKLYGNTLVDAHRLLKNSIPSNAYVMLSTDYLEHVEEFPFDYSTCGTYQCDIYDVGSLCYRYFPFDVWDMPKDLSC
ncbi:MULTISPECIES: DUF2652 domain-containing protein [Chryseobacterium]|uniref:DUF2652 domain-containing protein n=1 Tax=Chryseobacterium camelliae TaxID=1265445 RepID=A0ABU0TGI9_9FLAO|nr:MULTISPECIES: DUF2652 domain-containing protein [Chryseobacterium]MDT3406829.1 hypothetical protein [Pseudacidovorax intermedius]MDQ1095375.1 hypothetical protein [Chryseobacterium camelliae]MDQ1099313.1 hypothetical protein [Chryseobacterium sp. SORGH_AS_1048]MDR6086662.1 hypothetical protein [Chryseobacterium sp. SORGH_AS_0909]MDR6131034.1 hypothetical protein [Chryseobacterium sp. SORGH_AS_1175]